MEPLKQLGIQYNHNNSITVHLTQRLFEVPPVKNKTIPFTRVNHNKYMVTDNAAYIGEFVFISNLTIL